MNETLSVYLNLNMEEEDEALIERIDQLLLTVGLKDSGMGNIYVPEDWKNRDQAVFRGEQLLRKAEWLKGILKSIEIGTWTNVCPIEQIQTDRMKKPSPDKLQYYEEYYQKTKKLPHAIVVDEERQLRDGYTSYLIAKKYGAGADVCEAFSGQPLRKTVRGRHVTFQNGKWRVKNKKRYVWLYTLKKPVVRGDILLVNTKNGTDYICVDRIDYAAGQEFCSSYKKVKRHMNMRIEE